jgi:hypothetical protein
VRYNSSNAASCSGLRVGTRIGFMGSSSSPQLTPVRIYLFVLREYTRVHAADNESASSRTATSTTLPALAVSVPLAGRLAFTVAMDHAFNVGVVGAHVIA